MSLHQIRGNCKTCGAPRLFQKQGTNNVLHFLLCIPTVGVWLVIWIIAIIHNSFTPFRCTQCGEGKLR